MKATRDPASTAVSFDVRDYARTARGNHREQLELGSYAEHPLPADTLHLLRYLRELEAGTMDHLRNVLVTATHKDARVTAFLVTWAFEKFWIAEALGAVLTANGSPVRAEERPAQVRRGEHNDRRGPIRRAVEGMRVGVAIIAAHLAVGLVDEWVTRQAYEAVAAHTDNADLRATIALVLEVKARQSLFFDEEARRRLAESEKAAKLTRKFLATTGWPLGAIVHTAEDREFFERQVYGGPEGQSRAAQLESRVAALPGIDAATAARVRAHLAGARG